MNAFSQIDCMVGSGVLSGARGDEIKDVMAQLPTTVGELLLILTANSFMSSSSGGGGSVFDPVVVSGAYTASSGESIMANTSGGPFVLTLPLNPGVNDYVDIYDAQSTFFLNNLTVARNGQLINANAGNLLCDVSGAHIRLVFVGGAQGWSVFNL
jgi:hypothetical protein